MYLLRMSNRNETSFVVWSKVPHVGGPFNQIRLVLTSNTVLIVSNNVYDDITCIIVMFLMLNVFMRLNSKNLLMKVASQ